MDPLADTDSFHIINSSRDCIVIVLHNHPSLSDFSLLDIQFLLNYASIKMMTIVTNLGTVYYLMKQEKYDHLKAVALLNEAIEIHNVARSLKDMQHASDYFLHNCYKAGMIYGTH